ncbi:MAG: tRNA threonylcarbamoyladenosine dehydratase [Eggerthellaceae bacterium]|nr:tRNA threonylcarbamoyladenosine dehydratase [Eggerthellaceae bacterium]
MCTETLARAGIGQLTVVDKDDVGLTNLNRQIIATHETAGRAKVDVMRERIQSINPTCKVNAVRCFFLPDTASAFDFGTFDYAVDALDTVTAKLLFIETAFAAGTPFVSCMGTANKCDPSKLCVADISKTHICPLAKIIRKETRKRGIRHFKVVYSPEEPLVPRADEESERPDPGRRSLPGTHPAVPPTAGLLLAAEVINDLCRTTPKDAPFHDSL